MSTRVFPHAVRESAQAHQATLVSDTAKTERQAGLALGLGHEAPRRPSSRSPGVCASKRSPARATKRSPSVIFACPSTLRARGSPPRHACVHLAGKRESRTAAGLGRGPNASSARDRASSRTISRSSNGKRAAPRIYRSCPFPRAESVVGMRCEGSRDGIAAFPRPLVGAAAFHPRFVRALWSSLRGLSLVNDVIRGRSAIPLDRSLAAIDRRPSEHGRDPPPTKDGRH